MPFFIVDHPLLNFLSHGERFFQERGILLDVACAFGTRGAEGALEFYAVETGNPSTNAALCDVHRLLVGIGCGCEKVNFAELVIARVKGISAIEHRLELTAHLVIVNRRREHNDFGLLHLCGNSVCIIIDDTLALLLAGKATRTEGNLLASQRNDFHLVARLGRTLRKFLRHRLGIALGTQTARNH